MSEIIDFIKDLFSGGKKKTDEYDAARAELDKYIKENGSGGLPKKEELPSVPKYERLEYDRSTDEQLKDRAEKELADYYSSGTKAVEKEIDELKRKYESDKTSASKSAEDKTAALYSAYADAKEKTAADVLKRGLARSSIAVLRQSELDENAASGASKIANELYGRIGELDEKISELGAVREKALNDFNISYASKLSGMISDLKDERDKKMSEAVKYNNSLSEKEYKAEIDRKSKESDLYGEALSHRKLENELREAEYGYGEIYSKMRAVLKALDPKEAREMLVKDPVFRENLNERYYYMLYDEFGRRQA